MGKRGEIENLPTLFLQTEIKQGWIPVYWKISSPHRGRGKYQPMSFGGKYVLGEKRKEKNVRKRRKD
jgi:hypothetical protein